MLYSWCHLSTWWSNVQSGATVGRTLLNTHICFTVIYDDYDLVEDCSILSGDNIPSYYLEKIPQGPISEKKV